MSIITTEQLVLEPVTADDAAALHQLWTSPQVRRYLFDDRSISLEEALSFIELSESLFAESGAGLWAVRRLGEQGLAGFCGFLPGDEPGELQLLYGLAPEHWGQGLAREAARAVVRYGFDTRGLKRIIASVDEPNQSSLRLLEQLGMQRERRLEIEGRPTLCYAIERETFLAQG